MAQPVALIVEDQINLALLYEDALRLIGYNTVTIRNGLEALNHLQLNDDVPDVVILDVNLPGMSGRDILKHIRSKEKYAKMPVIILTANSLMVSQMRNETTALDYLFVKPISMLRLQELAKSMQRGADGLPQHASKTQKVPRLDRHGEVIKEKDEDTLPPDVPPTEPLNKVQATLETQETTIADFKAQLSEQGNTDKTDKENESD